MSEGLKEGDRVILNPNLGSREFAKGRGSVEYGEIGTFVMYSSRDNELMVDFPSFQGWLGKLYEVVPVDDNGNRTDLDDGNAEGVEESERLNDVKVVLKNGYSFVLDSINDKELNYLCDVIEQNEKDVITAKDSNGNKRTGIRVNEVSYIGPIV